MKQLQAIVPVPGTPAVPSGPSERPAHVQFLPRFYSVGSIGPHSSSARPENPEWGVCLDEGAAC